MSTPTLTLPLLLLATSATAWHAAPSHAMCTMRATHAASLRDTAAPSRSHTLTSPRRHDLLMSAEASVRPDLAAKLGQEPSATQVADVDAMLAASTFPLSPDTLIGLTKAYLHSQEVKDGVDWYSEDFRFVAPVVGPLPKQELLSALKTFNILSAFPDLRSNFHHFRVCPFEPNRVWFSVKTTGTNSGPILGRPATGVAVETPVQTHSVTFNEKGEITKLTIGYVMDRETGNTGGLGGIFGLLYGIGYGLPFREAQPFSRSLKFKAFNMLGRMRTALMKKTAAKDDA